MKLACYWFGHIQVDRNTHILIQETSLFLIWVHIFHKIKVIQGWFLPKKPLKLFQYYLIDEL